MISGGNATIYVSNMDAAVRFYTEVLGLKLTNRFGNHWATVQAGTTRLIGLHRRRRNTRGQAQTARCRLEANYLSFTDPDGNPIYVTDSDLSVGQQRAPTATQFDRV
jgi:hypothetical protein